jgi:hypothetical protein
VWLETLAAESAEAAGDGCGPEAGAREHYRKALDAAAERPSVYLLVAYADCLLRAERAADALAVLRSAPPADSVLLRLAVAERRLGRSSAAHLEQLGYRLRLALQGEETAHAREAAYFALYLLDEPELALARALDDWAVQREPIDSRLVLEAALASGDPAAARPVVDWLGANRVAHADLEPLIARIAQ